MELRKENKRTSVLTGDLDGGIGRASAAEPVLRHAPIYTGVVLSLALRHLEEEHGAVAKDDAVRGVLQRRPVFEPFDDGVRSALRAAVEGQRVVSRYCPVARVFGDPGGASLAWRKGERECE